MRLSGSSLAVLACLCTFTAGAAALPTHAQASGVSLSAFAAQAAASTPASADKPFGNEQLDQMTAPIALYPDALLAQILMASTYPGDVADAAKWSKANKSAKGEDAVKQVESQPWDPSVQSLVAFPQVLETLNQDINWVQKLGDAFLAQPDDLMASVQRLRNQAQKAGNLKSSEQMVVKSEPATGAMVQEQIPQTIVIESSDPNVVYVPSYDPSYVYGPWMYPSYPPYYYGYYPGAALFSFGVGMVVGGALWGNCNWGGGDIDIDVNNNFNRNTNRERTTNRGQGDRGSGKWQHNSANRDGTPYRDQRSRDQFGKGREGAAGRDAYRGRDAGRDASRDRARQSMSNSGFDSPARSNAEARDRAGQASRQADRGQGSFNNAQSRQGSRDSFNRSSTGGRNDAFSGSRSPGHSRASSSRGSGSYNSSRSMGSRGGGAGRSMSRPARGGGGGRRR